MSYLFDDMIQLSTTKLKEFGYFDSIGVCSGNLTWSKNDNYLAKISFVLNTDVNPYIELTYEYQGESRSYKIGLVFLKSNLGKGKIWFFYCPVTKKRCRKLYLAKGYFLHRKAFVGVVYESQTKSKSHKELDRIFGSHYDIDELYMELYQKNFKKFYNGVPTKRYLKIMSEIKRAESIDFDEIENILSF